MPFYIKVQLSLIKKSNANITLSYQRLSRATKVPGPTQHLQHITLQVILISASTAFKQICLQSLFASLSVIFNRNVFVDNCFCTCCEQNDLWYHFCKLQLSNVTLVLQGLLQIDWMLLDWLKQSGSGEFSVDLLGMNSVNVCCIGKWREMNSFKTHFLNNWLFNL